MNLKSIFIASYLVLIISSVSAQADPKPKEDTTKIYTKVEKPAQFPGGSNGGKSYLIKTIVYPKKAERMGIEGVVRVQFLVDKEGNVSEVGAINDPGGGLAEEAVRIIKTGPKWIPAEVAGQKVVYRSIQTITFQLPE